MEAVKLCNTEGMSREEWLAVRKHGPDGNIPITIGGSDAAAALGFSPWKTPLDLFLEKTEEIEIGKEDNSGKKEMGLLLEPIVAKLFQQYTGYEVLKDHWMYQHPKYPWAIADLDYLVRDSFGNIYILDCKTTNFRNISDIQLWEMGMIPYHYIFQGRLYMAVLDINKIYFACLWGTDPDRDFKIAELDRDMEQERKLLDDLETFVLLCQNGIKPVFGENELFPRLAIDSLRRIYKGGVEQTVILDASYREQISKLYLLDQERKRMNAETAQLENEIKKIMVPIVQAMKDHESARCMLEDGSIIQFDYKKSSGAKASRRKYIKRIKAA